MYDYADCVIVFALCWLVTCLVLTTDPSLAKNPMIKVNRDRSEFYVGTKFRLIYHVSFLKTKWQSPMNFTIFLLSQNILRTKNTQEKVVKTIIKGKTKRNTQRILYLFSLSQNYIQLSKPTSRAQTMTMFLQTHDQYNKHKKSTPESYKIEFLIT